MSSNHFKEVEIEDFIWKNIPNGGLNNRGLNLPIGLYYRQLNIGCGVVDMMCINVKKSYYNGRGLKSVSITVFELKRRALTCDSVGQICRYMNAIQENFTEMLGSFGMSGYVLDINGVLIGESITDDAADLLKNIESIDALFFGIGMQHGIEFQEFDKEFFRRSFELKSNPFSFMPLARVGGAVDRSNDITNIKKEFNVDPINN